jgi:sn-glycerol 3-phosphate transport system ATP-binding protein
LENALAHDRHAVAERHRLHLVVGDVDGRGLQSLVQPLELDAHLHTQCRVEVGERLVEEEHRGVRRDEIARRVGEAADLLEIAQMLDRKPRQLSGGQRQRVAMGRALVRDPKVFLFDEPLSNLDAKLRVQMRVEIRRLQRRLGTTSLYVTHDQLEAMTLADRLVVMNAGLVEQIGTPEEVYERPATLFVAGFIGSPPMNLLPRESLEAAVAGLPAGLPPGTGIVGIRPDQMALAAPADESLAIPATVELVEPAGGESYVYARLSGTGEAIVVRVQGKPQLPQDGAINLFVRVADLHPFDRETGRRAD